MRINNLHRGHAAALGGLTSATWGGRAVTLVLRFELLAFVLALRGAAGLVWSGLVWAWTGKVRPSWLG